MSAGNRLPPYVVTDRSARIEHIADLIRKWQFRYGETYKALAREWDVSYAYVRELGAEAFGIVRGEILEPEEVTASVCVGLERIMRDGMEAGQRRDAIEAAKVWAQLAKDSKRTTSGSGQELTEAVLESLLDAVRSRKSA